MEILHYMYRNMKQYILESKTSATKSGVFHYLLGDCGASTTQSIPTSN